MKTKFNGILTLLLALVVQVSFAQQKTVTGTVSDESGALPGVSVIIKGTATGTETDFDGNYTISAKTGDVLSFSYLGYKTVQKTVGSSNKINVTMEEDANVLDEVVVTAQGIKREAKALGYAVAVISSKDIESKPETDVAKILTGKIAGVEVNAGGGFLGTATNVIIRSKNSISGNNQPLYIIDGAPVNGSRSFDIDPNNIESTTVLKGLAASTLYGNDGRNGVILITTKTGSAGASTDKKFEVTYSTTTSVLEVANLPEFQNKYGQGADNAINTTYFGTWGAAFDGQTVPHHLSIDAYNSVFPEYVGATTTYEAKPNNVNDFFGKGYGTIHSLVINKNIDQDNGVSFSFGHTDQKGYIAENGLRRYNLNFGGRTKLTNNLSLNTSVGYNNTKTSRPTRNFFTLLTWIPRNLDIQNLPFENPNDGSSVYYRTTITNPRWQQKYTGYTEDTDRVFIKANLDYQINDKIKASYIYSLDNFAARNRDWYNKGSVESPLGFLSTFNNNTRTTNHRVNVSAGSYELAEDLKFNVIIGGEAKNSFRQFSGIQSEDQVVFNFLNHNNFREHTPVDSSVETNVLGLYGQMEFDYSNFLYLTLSARNDWGSTTAKENRSVFYPSASVSFIPSNVWQGLKGDNNNYFKLRAGYGSSANFPGAYLITPNLNANANAWINPFNGGILSTNAVSSFLPNPDLKPEVFKEFEVGVEGRVLKNLIDFNISAYKRVAKDQILSSGLPNSTGYSSTVINAGQIDTEGLEASITFNILKGDNDGVRWSMINNFTAYETTVVDLPVERIDVSSGINYAIEGEAYGVFRGTYAVRDDAGNLLINPETGKIIPSDDLGLEDQIIGDPNEDWRLTNINQVSYKNFSLSMQWEYIHGGDIYSNSASTLLRRGVTRDTEDRERSYIIPGVLADPNTGTPLTDTDGNAIKNNIQIGANDLYFINLMDVAENIVYDASVFRLRDVSLSYSMPENILDRTPFGSVVFTASGNNLWFKAPNLPKYMNLDPEVLGSGAGNGKGLDFQNDPSYKQYSLGVKITF